MASIGTLILVDSAFGISKKSQMHLPYIVSYARGLSRHRGI
jgi:hypothetical protein